MSAYRPHTTSEPPPGEVLPIGTDFSTVLGPRRLVYPGDAGYFQRDRRRYYCVVVHVADAPHRTQHDRLVTRRHCVVRVLELA